jgi:hypothetical protein
MADEPLSDRVVRIVDLQTTSKQPDTVAEPQVVQILAANGDFRGAEVREAISEAVEAGKVVRDEAGRLRVADGTPVPSRH